MLLYDRVVEWAERRRLRLPAAAMQRSELTRKFLTGAPVYDLSSVVPLMADWDQQKMQAVYKRPPHLVCWCEWDHLEETPHGDRHWQIGNLVNWWDKGVTLQCFKEAGGLYQDFVAGCDELYLVQRFFCLLRDPKPDGNPGPLPLLAEAANTFLWGMRNDATEAFEIICRWQHPDGREEPFYGLPTYNPLSQDANLSPTEWRQRYDPLCTSWPAFMAFALLNCKNVVAETHVPDERTQRRAQKAGCPPRCTYKTLKIEVPATVHKREGYSPDGGDDGPKVRLHLCRGHFKNLQHERYKNKGWHWWPACWRGSKEHGEVHKTYALRPSVEAKQ